MCSLGTDRAVLLTSGLSSSSARGALVLDSGSEFISGGAASLNGGSGGTAGDTFTLCDGVTSATNSGAAITVTSWSGTDTTPFVLSVQIARQLSHDSSIFHTTST